MKFRFTTFAAAALALALAGCATTVPTATAERLPVPTSFGNTAMPGATAPTDWRTMVADERLRRLIELALQNNRDLRVATLNIEKARASYRVSSAAQGPALNANGSATITGTEAGTTRQYAVNLGMAAWELDLWGRLGSLKDAALASVLATEQTQRAVQASLVAEVAGAWLQLSADQQRLALTKQTLASREQSLALTERRHAAGAGTGLDVSSARAATESARGDLALLGASVAQDRNALRLLVGSEPPATLLPADTAAAEAATTLSSVAAELPSAVLLQRPDVRSAELSLQAAQANVAAARAATFPTIALTASAGTASHALTDLFSAGSGVWSFVPTLKLPIFDGGASQANLQGAQASRDIQIASYEKTVQTAFKEVADALATRQSLTERLRAQQALVQAYETSLQLATERQRLGSESPLAVLDAQRSLYTAQQGLIALQLVEQGNRLTLFKALGGA